MSLLVPKHRKPKFQVQVAIQDLTNVPLVSGLVHVRWHLSDSLRSEARGKTERSPILDHKVEWHYETRWTAKLLIDKTHQLSAAPLVFEVYQEMYGGKERHALGRLEVNLAEYASSEQLVSRRHLLQNSKVNSTLRIGICMTQVSGDKDYRVPDLKKPQVFSGIAGLLSEGKEMKKRDDDLAASGGGAGGAYGPDRDSAADRVAMQLEQDVYRNSIVRRWQAQAGELDPASVVDDIFNGSDGWVKPYHEHDDLARHHSHSHAHGHGHGRGHSGSSHLRRQESEEQSLDDDAYRDGHAGANGDAAAAAQRRWKTDATIDEEDGWTPERQAFEADEMLRSLTWTIDPAQVNAHVGKTLEQRNKALLA